MKIVSYSVHVEGKVTTDHWIMTRAFEQVDLNFRFFRRLVSFNYREEGEASERALQRDCLTSSIHEVTNLEAVVCGASGHWMTTKAVQGQQVAPVLV